MINKPTTIYKYASLEVAESIISSNVLKFSNPKKFNDPFDCDIAGIFFDFTGNIDPKVSNDINILKKDFSQHTLTNELLAQCYQEVIFDKLTQSVITCFSLDNNNHLMWAHYGNNHTGICLGFDNTIPIKEKFTDLSLGMESIVSYGYEEKVNFVEDKVSGYYRLYCTKLKPWEYECEYRLIALDDEGLYHFQKKFLKEIIFGLRVSTENMERICRVALRCGHSDIKFYKSEIRDSNITYIRL